MKLVTFRVGDEHYALPLDDVQSIERMQPIRPVPLSSRHVVGILNLRGVVMTVCDLRSILSTAMAPTGDDTRLLVAGGLGFIVDEALDVIEIDPERVEPRTEAHALITGLIQDGDTLLALLNRATLTQAPQANPGAAV